MEDAVPMSDGDAESSDDKHPRKKQRKSEVNTDGESSGMAVGALAVHGVAVEDRNTGGTLEQALKSNLHHTLMKLDVLFEYGSLVKIEEYAHMRAGTHTESTFRTICRGATYFVQHEITGALAKILDYFEKDSTVAAALEKGRRQLEEGIDLAERNPANFLGLKDQGADGVLVWGTQRVIPVQITTIANIKHKDWTTFTGQALAAANQREAEHAAKVQALAEAKQVNASKIVIPDNNDLVSKINGIIIVTDKTVVSGLQFNHWRKLGVFVLRLKFPQCTKDLRQRQSKLSNNVIELFPTDAALEINPRLVVETEFKYRVSQIAAANALLAEYSQGRHGVCIIQSPTGSGKSIMIALFFEDFFWYFYHQGYDVGGNDGPDRNMRRIPGTTPDAGKAVVAPPQFQTNSFPINHDNPEERDPVFIMFFPSLLLCSAFVDKTLMRLDANGTHFLERAFGKDWQRRYKICNCSEKKRVDLDYLQALYQEGVRAFLFCNVKAEVVRQFQKWVRNLAVKDEVHENTYDDEEWKKCKEGIDLLKHNYVTFCEKWKDDPKKLRKAKKAFKTWFKQRLDRYRELQAKQPSGEFISASLHAINDAGNGTLAICGVGVSATPTQVVKDLPNAKTVFWRTEGDAILDREMCNYGYVLMSARDKDTKQFLKLKGMNTCNQQAVSAVQLIDGMQEYHIHFPYIPCGNSIHSIYMMQDRIKEAFASRTVVPGFENVKLKFYPIHGGGDSRHPQSLPKARKLVEDFKAAEKTEVDADGVIWKVWHFIMDCRMMRSGVDIPNCDAVAYACFPKGLSGRDVIERLIQMNRASRIFAGKLLAYLFIPRQADDEVVQALVNYAYDNDSDRAPSDIASRFTVRTVGGSKEDAGEDILDSIAVRAKYERKTYMIARETRKEQLALAVAQQKEDDEDAAKKKADEEKLKGIPLKVSNSAHPDRQLCLCFRLMLVGGKRECLSWTSFRNDRRGQAAPATATDLDPNWRFVLAEPYFKNLGITAAEAWILVAFLMEAPASTRPTPYHTNRDKQKAQCKLCKSPSRADSGEKVCCKWGACLSKGGQTGTNGYCFKHFRAVTEKAQAALAETQPGVAYDAATHFALGDVRVQADPETKRVPGKVYVPVKNRPTSAGAGSSTDPLPPSS